MKKTWFVELDKIRGNRLTFTVWTEALRFFREYEGHAVLRRGGILLDEK